MTKCTVCKNDVNWEEVIEVFEEDLEQLDSFGWYSLTEHQQMVAEGKICSTECYENLK